MSNPINKLTNNLQILELLRTQGPLSRADIARSLNITKATSSRIMRDLEDKNLISKIGMGSVDYGRKPVLYKFNSDSHVVIGVEIKHESCLAVVTNLKAKPIYQLSRSLPDTEIETFLEVFDQIYDECQREFSDQVVGIGIGIPGIYDYEANRVILAEDLGWVDVNLAEMIHARTHKTVYIVNRANAAALGEKWYGSGKDCKDIVYIGIGSGIGAGIVLNGELYWGANGSAGEVGHMTISPGGPLCKCGKRGCLEALASTIAIQERVKALIRTTKNTSIEAIIGHPADQLTTADIVKAANVQDKLVVEILEGVGEYIGLGAAYMINALNPQRVIIGGFASQAPSFFLEAIKRSAQAHAFSIPWQAVEIVKSELGGEAAAIGAAALLLSKYFIPQVTSMEFWNGIQTKEQLR